MSLRTLARKARSSKWVKHSTLFAGMYLATVVVVGIESGSILTGMYLGIFTSTIKTAWAWTHAAMFGAH